MGVVSIPRQTIDILFEINIGYDEPKRVQHNQSHEQKHDEYNKLEFD